MLQKCSLEQTALVVWEGLQLEVREQGARPTSPLLLPSQVVNQVLERTSSGGFCGNDTLMHATLTSLPFGGIGRSKSPNLPSVSQVGSPPTEPEPWWGRVSG